jgi:hypothetical protein
MPELRKARKEMVDLMLQVAKAHHPHLKNAVIRLIERSPNWKSKGRIVFGQTKKASDMDRALDGGYIDFIITINAEAFWSENLTDVERKAILDHELCHCGYDEEEEAYYVKPHDVEEFNEIIQRYGTWTPDLESFFDARYQLDLFKDADVPQRSAHSQH